MFDKYNGVGNAETGLGMNGTVQNEITQTTFILFTWAGGSPVGIIISSITNGETADLYGSNDYTSIGEVLRDLTVWCCCGHNH